MDLSVRALNCLKAAEVDTLGDLVSFKKWPNEIP
jgi:DNA-directed RNA polymerase subunit alpha